MKRLNLFIILLVFSIALLSCNHKKMESNLDNFEKKTIDYLNHSTEFEGEDGKIETYFFENEEIPYVSYESFLNGVSYYSSSLDIKLNIKGGIFDYEIKSDFNSTHHIIDSNKDTINISNYGLFDVDEVSYKVLPEYNYMLNANFEWLNSEKNSIINLNNYSLDIREADNKVLIPFHVLESLFSFESYFNVYFLGSSYVGLSYNDHLSIDELSKDANIPQTESFLNYNYNFIRYLFNEFYGLDGFFDDFDMNEYLLDNKDCFLNKDTYAQAINDLEENINDPHTSFYNYGINPGDYVFSSSKRSKQMSNAYKSIRNQKANYSTVEYLDSTTAMISFNSFMVDENGFAYKFIKNYVNELLEKGIKNVVLDITTNGGGDTFSLAQILGLMTNEDIVFDLLNLKNDSHSVQTFKVDANLDGSYDDSDAYTDFNYYVLCSNYSFSCASGFAYYCKEMKLATLIGEKTGGGACTVYYSMLPYFTFLQVGGPNVFTSEYEYELGVDVQYEIPQDKLLDKDAILAIVNK